MGHAVELKKKNNNISRLRITRLMKRLGLFLNYTVAQFKPHKQRYNDAPVKNELQHAFKQEEKLAVSVSDLTYVHVLKKALCVLICRPF